MIDWDALVLAPCEEAFAEEVSYHPGTSSPIYTGAPLSILGIFDAGYTQAGELDALGVNSSAPRLGVRITQFPARFDAERAQGDRFVVVRTGKVYTVKSGQADSHGNVRLDANQIGAL